MSKIQGKVDAQAVVARAYPEIGEFADAKSLQKFYKQLTIEQLEEWATLDGLEFKACKDSEAIHRMRVCMAILYEHFPKAEAKKPASQYKSYTTEQLVQMALDNEVAVELSEDDKITRMRLIMKLRESGLLEAKTPKKVMNK